jgi:hypothetical protein
MDNGSPLSGVNLSDALWGTTVATTTSDSDGDFVQTSLALGRHSLTYSKSGYLDSTMNELLDTDGQTLNLETVRMIPDNCTSGIMSGTIRDAVTGDELSNAWLWYQPGMNHPAKLGGDKWKFAGNSDDNGTWKHVNERWSDYIVETTVAPGWYSMLVMRTGYYYDTFNVYSCGNQANQDHSLSPELEPGMMRIMLRWPKTNPVTAIDLDSHLYIPIIDIDASRNTSCDGDSDRFDKCHLYFRTNQSTPASYKGIITYDYHIYGTGDNVTLDKDHNVNSNPASPPGSETITISKVRSGTYSFSVHNITDKDNDTDYFETNLRQSRANVNLVYCPEGADCNDPEAVIRKRFHVPNDNGTLWRVFTFNSSDSGGSGFTRVRKMTYQNDRVEVY